MPQQNQLMVLQNIHQVGNSFIVLPNVWRLEDHLWVLLYPPRSRKTVNVTVDRFRVHPKYVKRLCFTCKFSAQEEEEVCHLGDTIIIIPDWRYSFYKHFKVPEIIKAKGVLYEGFIRCYNLRSSHASSASHLVLHYPHCCSSLHFC